jgi:hypothetical protein
MMADAAAQSFLLSISSKWTKSSNNSSRLEQLVTDFSAYLACFFLSMARSLVELCDCPMFSLAFFQAFSSENAIQTKIDLFLLRKLKSCD